MKHGFLISSVLVLALAAAWVFSSQTSPKEKLKAEIKKIEQKWDDTSFNEDKASQEERNSRLADMERNVALYEKLAKAELEELRQKVGETQYKAIVEQLDKEMQEELEEWQ